MNFLLRPAQTVAAEQTSVREFPTDVQYASKPAATLEGLIAEDPYPQYSTADEHVGENDVVGGESGSVAGPSAKNDTPITENHSDVTEDEGWITIPYKELPDNWNDAPDISSFRSLNRSFVFPGEQVHILACLSASKQDTEIITPFKVAAVMSKNGKGQNTKNQNGNIEQDFNSFTNEEVNPDGQYMDEKGENLLKEKVDPQKDISASESLLRMEDHKRQTETLLHRFRNSHFFVRIAESGEPLWSKRKTPETYPETSEIPDQKLMADEIRKTGKKRTTPSAVIDRGDFNANVSGGLARTVECCSLSNGDIVVLLQVNVGIDFLQDPILEIRQFEKFQNKNLSLENQDSAVHAAQDPCEELLKWLLPLDNTLPPPARPLSPPLNSSGVGNVSQRSNYPASSGSQLFSFGHFRSYSMSSIPQSTAPPPPPVTNPSSKPNFDLENWDRFSSQKILNSKKTGNEELLSFRGVSLEPERFSVHCGLEGIYTPGRRWRRKLEIIQPVEIHSFSSDCNTDDLLCVQIKNISPAHTPDIVVFLDAITVVFEEASKGGPPISLPIACIEAGNNDSLPNLPLRRGEEHSFILKPATSLWKNIKADSERSSQSPHLMPGNAASSLHLPSKIVGGKGTASTTDHYAVVVSCRCNFTESRLFFKKPTSWRPRLSRDLMISVASEMSRQSLGPNGGVSQLPVQVLTLQASNLTSEDLTLTVLAPASFNSPPSILSLNPSPSTPPSSFIGFSEFTGKVGGERHGTAMQRLNSVPPTPGKTLKQNSEAGVRPASLKDPAVPIPDVIPSTDLGCTHLWLHSRVPLGCVPSRSTTTIKLELLPLTDGIITLDTLQIDVKEKGLTYVPDHSLKINATSSISTGII
ncbi:uncharacterized protein LOC131144579 [Malania oleifera]|uniref:uncharacterized protein LOC131144579 n=1 Tax=Malania oleifera TaxID=397392 RepID=UPI0025AE41CB|nr:uncharacterized protein LOC131144579 [Malania oleifera]XP_057949279.1 uncharacterized protein LOC131144579 [Malania oleifera]XP_057949280.1 uncharacterized protein LOC131144579 [Malania oleifera]